MDPHILRELILRIITNCDMSLKLCGHIEFRLFLRYVSPEANSLHPDSDSTMKADLNENFVRKKDVLIAALKPTKSRVHLALDGWTSPNEKGKPKPYRRTLANLYRHAWCDCSLPRRQLQDAIGCSWSTRDTGSIYRRKPSNIGLGDLTRLRDLREPRRPSYGQRLRNGYDG